MSRAGTPIGDEARAREPGRRARARLSGHRDAAQQPDRLRLRVLRHHHGLRADLAHLVDGGARRSSAPTRPSWSSPGATAPRIAFRPPKWRGSTARIARARRAALAQWSRPNERRSAPDRRRPRRRGDRRARRRGAAGRPSRRSASRRLRLLDLPAQRHRDVLGVLRRLRRALRTRPPAGRAAQELFDLDNVALETACLLLSTFTCGMASLGAGERIAMRMFFVAMAVTLPRRCLPFLEVREFVGMSPWRRPQRSAFLSSFFTLVGCHGVHVTRGLLWLRR